MANRWAYSIDGEDYTPAGSRLLAISAAEAKLDADNQPGSTATYYVAQQVPPVDVFDGWQADNGAAAKAVFGQMLLDQFNRIIASFNQRPRPALTMTDAELTAMGSAALTYLRNNSTIGDHNVINVQTFTHTTPV